MREITFFREFILRKNTCDRVFSAWFKNSGILYKIQNKAR